MSYIDALLEVEPTDPIITKLHLSVLISIFSLGPILFRYKPHTLQEVKFIIRVLLVVKAIQWN